MIVLAMAFIRLGGIQQCAQKRYFRGIWCTVYGSQEVQQELFGIFAVY